MFLWNLIHFTHSLTNPLILWAQILWKSQLKVRRPVDSMPHRSISVFALSLSLMLSCAYQLMFTLLIFDFFFIWFLLFQHSVARCLSKISKGMLSGVHCWNRFNPCLSNLSIKRVSMLVLMERRRHMGLMIQDCLLIQFLPKWRGMLFMKWVCLNFASWLKRLNFFTSRCVKIFRTQFKCQRFAAYGLREELKIG